MRRLQIGLMVYHFRYNVGYQTYLVLLTKYLLHPAKSFSAFSVTFAIRFEKLLNFITGFINLITNCKAYEKVIYFDCSSFHGCKCECLDRDSSCFGWWLECRFCLRC